MMVNPEAFTFSSTMLQSSSNWIADSAFTPAVEAEVLADMAHLALDITTFLTPATTVLRLLTVVGRVMAIESDYLPDHAFLPEEFVWQSLMLTLACASFHKTMFPRFLASFAPMSIKDKRTYQVLFADVGVSWNQYKTLSATSFDWLEVEPLQYVDNATSDGEYFYWLYRGDAEAWSNGIRIQEAKRETNAPRLSDSGAGMIGEFNFLGSLHSRRKKHKKSFKKILSKYGSSKEDVSKAISNTIIRAGPSGATLLRIHTSSLLSLMENDDQLDDAVHCLLNAGLQEKLCALLARQPTTQQHIAFPAQSESAEGSRKNLTMVPMDVTCV
jgi:hypothetical protein